MKSLNVELVKKLEPFLLGLRAYHRYEAEGLESIPENGKALLVLSHSLATYDIALLFYSILERRNRVCRPLVDRLFYKVPFVRDLIDGVGAKEGSPETAKQLLEEGEIVAVAPGGMKEALKNPDQKYQLMWEGRKGFARLSIETGAPIIIAICPSADEMYEIVPNKVTNWVYKKFRIPLFIAKGFGKTPLPKPVKLVHYLSEPMKPPRKNKDKDAFERQVVRFHKKILKTAEELMETSVAKEKGSKGFKLLAQFV